jgi:phage gp46-like protein
MTIDLKFTQDNSGQWHFDIEDGDLETTDSLDTALYMSLFGEKRAGRDDVTKPDLRRGNFANEFSRVTGYEVGSLFWLRTEQVKLTDSNLRLIEDSVTDGLKWMVQDEIISKTRVVATKADGGVNLEIALISKLQEDSKYFNLFVATK